MKWNERILVLGCALLALLASGTCRAESPAPAAPVMTVASLETGQPLSGREAEWFRKFMHGTFFCDGWLETTDKILSRVEPEQRASLAPQLAELGRRIGREWARANNERRIDTAMLKSWGKRLKKAAEREPDKLVVEIRTISAEVDRLLR